MGSEMCIRDRKYYVPNTQNVPLISERGETNLTLSGNGNQVEFQGCLLYTSDAADERSSVDLGGRRIIKKKTNDKNEGTRLISNTRR